MIRVEVTRKEQEVSTFDVEKVLAASPEFPYWTFWYPPDLDGNTRVCFFALDEVREVNMIGKDTDDDSKPKLAQVIPLKRDPIDSEDIFSGGDDIGPV